jgi:hypothetical protein
VPRNWGRVLLWLWKINCSSTNSWTLWNRMPKKLFMLWRLPFRRKIFGFEKIMIASKIWTNSFPTPWEKKEGYKKLLTLGRRSRFSGPSVVNPTALWVVVIVGVLVISENGKWRIIKVLQLLETRYFSLWKM